MALHPIYDMKRREAYQRDYDLRIAQRNMAGSATDEERAAARQEYEEFHALYQPIFEEAVESTELTPQQERKVIADRLAHPDPDALEEAWTVALRGSQMEAQQEADMDAQRAADFQARSGAIMDEGRQRLAWGTSAPSFKEQCFLLSHIQGLAKWKRDTKDALPGAQGKFLPYISYQGGTLSGNASLLIDGDPYRLMNRLTQYPSQKVLHDIRPEELSHLQPMIRLFKVRDRIAAPAAAGDPTADPGPFAQWEELQEFRFDSHLTPTDVTGILSSKEARGAGVGIQNFTFSYEADNLFAVKKSIKAKLTLFANSFEELLRNRDTSGDASRAWSYSDLALKTGSDLMRKYAMPQQPDASYDNLDKLNFRLKAVIGWALPTVTDAFTTPGIRDAINESFVTLNLTPTIHEFNIDDQGRVQFVIHYLAYVEDYFDQPGFNIFTDPAVAYNILERKLIYETAAADCTKADDLKKLKEGFQEQIAADKVAATRALLSNMRGQCHDTENTSLIFMATVPYSDINGFMAEGPYYEYSGSVGISTGIADQYLSDLVDDAHSDDEESPETTAPTGASTPVGAAFKYILSGNDPAPTAAPESSPIDSVFIPFFYTSDLVDSILLSLDQNLGPNGLVMDVDVVQREHPNQDLAAAAAAEKARLRRTYEQFQKLRVVLGPMEITNPKEPAKSSFVSMGDIPISVKYFIAWLTKKILQEDEVVYTLSRFLNEFFNELVRNFLNSDECFNGQIRQPTRVSQAAITSYRAKVTDPDEITDAIIKQDRANGHLNIDVITGIPLLNVSGESEDPRGVPEGGGLNREINYLTYFAGRIMPAEQATGDKVQDAGRGIFHYGIGRDRGLVKTINFRKTPAKYLKELRFEQEGYDGLQQLREQYDVEIKSFSNVTTFPGVYIYVDPLTVDPSTDTDLTQLGIGGYHMIIRSEHSFGPGLAESTITAKWVAEKYNGTDPSNPTGTSPQKKCAGRGQE